MYFFGRQKPQRSISGTFIVRYTIPKFQKTIIDWFEKNGRHDLPWRKTTNPYRILVSEVMLQQTQVDRVKEKYREFLKHFATPKKLASASPAEVLAVWKGLGYNRRALYLKRAAEMIVTGYRGRFPREVSEIEKLPGVGHYTARAVAVFAFNQPHVFIETNIRRVFIHFFFTQKNVIARYSDARRNAVAIPKKTGSLALLGMTEKVLPRDDRRVDDKDLMPFIEKALYYENPRLWYGALMDYGAMAFSGISNPNQRSWHYTKQSRFEGSRRYARAKILDFLLKNKHATPYTLQHYFLTDKHLEPYSDEGSIDKLLRVLKKEGFIGSKKGMWSLITKS